MKLTGGILIVLSGGLIGLLCAYRLIKRVSSLRSADAYIAAIENEMRYSMRELPEILSSFQNGVFYIKNHKLYGTEYMKEEDRRVLSSLIDLLGSSDIETQLYGIKIHREALAFQIKEAQEEKRSKTRIYVTMGFAIGLFLALILV